MARGTTLTKLLDDLREELGLSLNPAHNVDVRLSHVRRLQKEQERLWEENDWSHLRVSVQLPLQSGQRYYSPPSNIRVDRIEKIEVFESNGWQELTPGIEACHYTGINSDLDERDWPPRRWDIHDDQDIELWPIADQNADPTTLEGMLRVTGIRSLNPLVQDDDRADLDDALIVAFATAKLKARAGAKDSQLTLDFANKRLLTLTGNLKPRKQIRMFGIGTPQTQDRMVVRRYRPPV